MSMIDEVVKDFNTLWEDALIQRRDRKRTLAVLADPNVFGTETGSRPVQECCGPR